MSCQYSFLTEVERVSSRVDMCPLLENSLPCQDPIYGVVSRLSTIYNVSDLARILQYKMIV